MNVYPKKDWLWVNESQIIKNNVTYRYMKEGEYHHDPIRLGYYIEPKSKTHVLLSLKGVKFNANQRTD